MSPIDIKSIYHTDIITIPEKVISHPKPGIMSVSTRCLENMNEDVFLLFLSYVTWGPLSPKPCAWGTSYGQQPPTSGGPSIMLMSSSKPSPKSPFPDATETLATERSISSIRQTIVHHVGKEEVRGNLATLLELAISLFGCKERNLLIFILFPSKKRHFFFFFFTKK